MIITMPKKYNNILKHNHGEKSMKRSSIIYANSECLLEILNTCHNNPEKLSTTKINKHTASGCSLYTYCSFDITKSKLNYYRGRGNMKNFCKDLREHAIKIINYEKKEMILLAIGECQSHHEQNMCYICRKEFITDDKKHYKVREHCYYTGKYRGAAPDICNLRYKIPKEIPAVFHNGSTYDYLFIINELAEEFKREFICLGENTEKYITLTVPIKKELDNNYIQNKVY